MARAAGARVSRSLHAHDTGCTFRTANDVSAVAQGAAVYDQGDGGWIVIGGTSVSSPMIAGVFGLSNNFTKQHGGKTFWTQSSGKYASDLHDITSGSLDAKSAVEPISVRPGPVTTAD